MQPKQVTRPVGSQAGAPAADPPPGRPQAWPGLSALLPPMTRAGMLASAACGGVNPGYQQPALGALPACLQPTPSPPLSGASRRKPGESERDFEKRAHHPRLHSPRCGAQPSGEHLAPLDDGFLPSPQPRAPPFSTAVPPLLYLLGKYKPHKYTWMKSVMFLNTPLRAANIHLPSGSPLRSDKEGGKATPCPFLSDENINI